MEPASRDARVFIGACLGIALFVSGCTFAGRSSSEVARLEQGLKTAPRETPEGTLFESRSPADANKVLRNECTRIEAETWADQAETSAEAALKAAVCYAALVKCEKEKGRRLADARKGRGLAEKAVTMDGENGFAHYVLAYLTGLEAENNPARGLTLVPIIEREALTAANLDSKVDQGGPDRMLGELYLRAPGFPMSVGDCSKAVFHYRRAVTTAPACQENRLGLVEALLADGESQEACGELKTAFEGLAADSMDATNLEKALKSLSTLCSKVQ